MYRKGSGVIQDYEKAVEWYRSSAEQGNVEAASNLALMYYKGGGCRSGLQEIREVVSIECEIREFICAI